MKINTIETLNIDQYWRVQWTDKRSNPTSTIIVWLFVYVIFPTFYFVEPGPNNGPVALLEKCHLIDSTFLSVWDIPSRAIFWSVCLFVVLFRAHNIFKEWKANSKQSTSHGLNKVFGLKCQDGYIPSTINTTYLKMIEEHHDNDNLTTFFVCIFYLLQIFFEILFLSFSFLLVEYVNNVMYICHCYNK